jgi:hypothetical protein
MNRYQPGMFSLRICCIFYVLHIKRSASLLSVASCNSDQTDVKHAGRVSHLAFVF